MGRAGLGKVGVRLTPKQQRFAAEYPVDLCGAKAAVRAGYSPKTADRLASRLLRHPGVAALLEEHAARIGEQLDLTVQRLETELARIAYVDPRKLRGEGGKVLELHELDENTARAVASVKVRVAKVISGRDAGAFASSLGVETPAGRSVEEVVLETVETKFHPKVEAIALALKRLGALVERHEVISTTRELTDEEFRAVAILHHQVRPAASAAPGASGATHADSAHG